MRIYYIIIILKIKTVDTKHFYNLKQNNNNSNR